MEILLEHGAAKGVWSYFFSELVFFCIFFLKYRHGNPDALNTATLGRNWVLNPKALQPFGFCGSQVT